MSTTRQRSPFLTQPPREVRRVRSLRRVMTMISDRGAVAGGQRDLSTVDGAVEQQPFGAGPLVQSSHGVG